MGDIGAYVREQRPDARKDFLARADHDGERAALGGGARTCNRRVGEVHAAGAHRA